ncbi:hypothetical protein, partial [Geobacillus thermodenitrificans]|uniref:hypothetical protein n=1 Tax=Geobacillus thermodenitrificans TaxID=33940 RepID=UPI002E1E8F91|nr:hypothetical protein [Geobacillus thermodenitrificans]
ILWNQIIQFHRGFGIAPIFLVWPKHRSFPPFLPRLTFIIKQLVDFVDKLKRGSLSASPLLTQSVIL